MRLDDASNHVELLGAKAMTASQPDRIKPELARFVLALDVYMGWLAAVEAREEEPVWTRYALDSRHSDVSLLGETIAHPELAQPNGAYVEQLLAGAKAAIDKSGTYNRTLTPFGFQAEERDLWRASAEKVNEPILIVHGQGDNNPGTNPIQSKRFYAALKGKGTTTRLVMVPLEFHGYRARESVLHLLWENSNWLDKWLKNRPGEQSASRP